MGILFVFARHKLQHTVSALMGMGFTFEAAEAAARTSGANLEQATQLLLEGGALQLPFLLTVSARSRTCSYLAMPMNEHQVTHTWYSYLPPSCRHKLWDCPPCEGCDIFSLQC